MQDLTISRRIWLLAFMFTTLSALVGGFGAWNTVRLSREVDAIGHTHLVATRDMTLVDMYHDGLAAKVYKALEYASEGDAPKMAETKKEQAEMAETMHKTVEELSALKLAEANLAALNDARPAIDAYIKVTSMIVATAATDGRKAALAHMGEFETAFKDLETRFDKLGDMVEEGVKARVNAATDEADTAQRWNFGLLAAGLLAGLAIARLFIRDLFRTLDQVATAFQEGSSKLVDVATQIATSSTSLAESTTEQSAAIEETVSSMEEMGSMIAQTNQSADLTTREADTSVHDARDGRQVVASMIDAMQQISGANERLQGIVKVIEDINSKTKIINEIAFETRLLAFNASIEAARAGAHGRGFAVVAEEVGKLANVSGKAADEVRALLADSVAQVGAIIAETRKKVEGGHATSQSCEQAFGKMESSVNKITQGIQRIAAATKEQDIGVRQTNKAMVEMEKVTQSNSRNAEKLSAHSSELRRAAADLLGRATQMQTLVVGRAGGSRGAPPASGVGAREQRPAAANGLVHHADKAPDARESPAADPTALEKVEREDSRWHAA